MLRDPRVERAGRQLRQPLARAEQARRRRPRHRALSGVRREPARCDGAGDEAVRRQPGARQPRASLELLTADYSFLNERLATHYGIRNVYGSHFRRVTFTDGTRGGLLGQASILTVTSYPNRTSVTMRGRWLLANLLGAPPPPPPPDIPALDEAGAAGSRDRFASAWRGTGAIPRARRVISGWIRLGFALENFDALGKWRSGERRRPDRCRRRRFPDGTPIRGSRRSADAHRQPQGRLRADADREAAGLCDRAVASTITTCRSSARSCATLRRPITPGHRSSRASSRARRSA